MHLELFSILTNKSRFPTRIYLSIKSKIVSQQAVNVGDVRSSFSTIHTKPNNVEYLCSSKGGT